jgi:hypothetical protein
MPDSNPKGSRQNRILREIEPGLKKHQDFKIWLTKLSAYSKPLKTI